ncbi:MAG: histidinol phosphate phosphatase [Alphaproteobacteria bacterium]|nr:histidinol phosphate phosphatase [Alphaproteobacteria bacterium]
MWTCPDEFIAFAHRLADAAGEVHRRTFRTKIAIEIKPDGSLVTAADKETEIILRDLIEQAYPDHGIGGEEFPHTRTDAEFLWALDPIDGTQDYVAGKPVFGALIALVRGGRPVLGVIEQAIVGDRWVGADGHGTRLNGAAVRTRPCPSIAAALVSTSGPGDYAMPYDDHIARVRQGAGKLRFGADCGNYGLVAAGFMDVVCDAQLSPHDFAALEVVVRNAGGTFTDWQGQAMTMASDGRVLAAGDRAVHAEALARLQD